MNKQEYAEYEERVRSYLMGCQAVSTGPCPDCPDCEDCRVGETDEYLEEPWFSWSPCEICGAIAGNRSSWHCLIASGVAHHEESQLVHGSCCEDCGYYLNYGRLDDSTMLDVESAS